MRHTRRAIREIARETGVRMVSRPVFPNRPDLDMSLPDVEPAFGLQVSCQLWQAARSAAVEYIRYARENGSSWHEIGAALGLEGQPRPSGSIAEAAYDYAVGNGPTERRTFAWVCPGCRRTVCDRGPEGGHPDDCEPGHADGCSRQAAAVAAWNAQWEEDSQ